MVNALGNYNPIFYAQEALKLLEMQLGSARRIHRGYEQERRNFEKGDTVSIRKPGDFVVADAPIPNASASDLDPKKVDIVLDQWKEIKYAITDKESSYMQEDIMREHVRPAVYRLCQYIEAAVNALALKIPWRVQLNSTPGSVITDITAPYTVLFNNQVPMDPSALHYMIDGTTQQGFLGLAQFAQWQGSGMTGVQTQLSGNLGNRYGMEIFPTQNVASYLSGGMADVAGTVTANVATGALAIPVTAFTFGGTLKAGDILVVSGHPQQYVVTANITLDGAGAGSVAVFPAVVGTKGQANAIPSGAVITASIPAAGVTRVQNLAFHRNFAALVMVPISTMGQGLGARMFTATDPKSGLSVRARLYYDGGTSKVFWAFDVLYGLGVLDANLAVRAEY